MNPGTNRRGCFIRKEDNGTFTVVDYPTWSFDKYGYFTPRQNEPIADRSQAEASFQTLDEAKKFCANENMTVCAAPKSKPVDSTPEDYN